MNKSGFLIIFLTLAIACETSDEQLDNDYIYGRLLAASGKHLTKILLDDIIIFELEYDSLERLTELRRFNSETMMQNEIYQYNSSNQVIERKYGSRTDYFMYENGLLAEQYSTHENNSEWRPRIIYCHDSDEKIVKANTYFNNTLTGYIEFEYDSKGNSVSRRAYYQNGDETYLENELKCNYDDKHNPIQLINFYPIDIIQRNNVIYYYQYSIWMSRMDTEYNSTFVYDNDGFPIEEKRFYKGNFPDNIFSQKYTYVYNE